MLITENNVLSQLTFSGKTTRFTFLCGWKEDGNCFVFACFGQSLSQWPLQHGESIILGMWDYVHCHRNWFVYVSNTPGKKSEIHSQKITEPDSLHHFCVREDKNIVLLFHVSPSTAQMVYLLAGTTDPVALCIQWCKTDLQTLKKKVL